MLDEIDSEVWRNARASNAFGDDVLAFAAVECSAGRDCAIVTLAAIEGAAPRAIGAQMAVAQDGRFTGSISSGCLERAIIAEAQAVIARRSGGMVRYGRGSPFVDIVLPCGSGLDLLFTATPSHEALHGACEALQARTPATLTFSATGVRAGDTPGEGAFVRRYAPAMQIFAFGVGAELIAFSRVASAAGYAVTAVSPETETLSQASAAERCVLQATSAPDLRFDRWSAAVFLFHDREWERDLLPSALASEAFYVGAVGSRRTQAARLEWLREAGVGDAALARLHGPIGLVAGARDPATLAVSTLAEILAARPAGAAL